MRPLAGLGILQNLIYSTQQVQLILLYRITATTAIATAATASTATILFNTPPPTPTATALSLPLPAQYYTDLQNASGLNTPARQFGYIGAAQQGALLTYRREVIAYTRLIDGLYSKVQPAAYNRCAANRLIYRIYYTAFYSQKTLGHQYSECRLVNKKCLLPKRGPKPRLSRASRGKGGRGGRGGKGGQGGVGEIGGRTVIAIQISLFKYRSISLFYLFKTYT